MVGGRPLGRLRLGGLPPHWICGSVSGSLAPTSRPGVKWCPPTLFIKIWTMWLSRIVHILYSRGDGELTERNVRGQVLDPSRSLGMTGKEGMDSGSGAGMTGGDQPHIPFLRPFDSAQGERNTPSLGGWIPVSGHGNDGRGGGGPFGCSCFDPPAADFQRAPAWGGSSTGGMFHLRQHERVRL